MSLSLATTRATLSAPFVNRDNKPTVTVGGLKMSQLAEALALLDSSPLVAFQDWERTLLEKSVKNPLEHPDFLVLCATDINNKLVGLLLGSSGFRGHVSHLIVDPKERGRGIGKMLLYASEECFQRRGVFRAVLTITAENNQDGAARDFYGKCGYLPVPGEVTLEKDLELV